MQKLAATDRPRLVHRSSLVGYSLVLSAATLWSLLAVFSTEAQKQGLNPLEVSFWRATGAGTVFAAQSFFWQHAHTTSALRRLRLGDAVRLLFFAVVGVALLFASLNFTIRAGGVSLAFVLLYTAPAFVAMGAWPILGERPTSRTAALVATVSAGVALVASSRGEGINVTATSLSWGLCCGLAYSTYYLVAKPLFARLGVALVYALASLIGGVVLLPLVPFTHKTLTAWVFLAAIVVLSTWAANLAYGTGVSMVPASKAVLVATIEPVFAAGLGAAFYGERFGAVGFLGAGLVILAALMSVRPSTQKTREPSGAFTS